MKRVISFSCVVLTALTFARNASSQGNTDSTSSLFYLPVAVHTPGLFGSFFKTHVAFYNATASRFPVQVTLYDSNGATHNATFDLGPNQSMAFADFVDEVFHLTGAGTVKFDSGNAANKIALSADVYTNGPCGDFGTDVPAISATLSAAESITPGVTNNEAQRTNVACFNGSASANRVVAEVFDQENHVVQTLTLDLAGNAWRQIPITAPVEGGYVRFHPSAPAYCYGVVVTNLTNDGRFIPGQIFTP
jgi:hypothetical protein